MKLQLIFIMVLLAFCIPCFAQTQNTDTYLVVSYHREAVSCQAVLENKENKLSIETRIVPDCGSIQLGMKAEVFRNHEVFIDGSTPNGSPWTIVKAERKHK